MLASESLSRGVIFAVCYFHPHRCLTKAAIKINRFSFDPYGYSAYLKKVGDFIQQNPSAADKPLDQIIASQVSCNDVLEKDKEIKAKWSK